ncbi:MAG: hypothetical protein COA35_017945 [Colwellia sp.]|nr:hypothetical protein [Colwellia sp.]
MYLYSHDTTAAHKPLKAKIHTEETTPHIDIKTAGKLAFGEDINIPLPKGLGSPRLEKIPNKAALIVIKNKI